MKQIQGLILFLLISFFATAEDGKHPALNTAEKVNYLTPLEKDVIYEINLFRSNPARYAEQYIEPLARYYDKKILHYPGDRSIQTMEGVRALNECVRDLKKASSQALMYPSKELSQAARKHQKDQQKTGKTGHIGSDGSNMRQRVEKFGKWQVRIGENIAYGNSSARQIVIFLLIDDGVKDRGHRATLLHPAFKLVGVACGLHPVYETMCVMDFAGGMAE